MFGGVGSEKTRRERDEMELELEEERELAEGGERGETERQREKNVLSLSSSFEASPVQLFLSLLEL